MCPMPMIFPGSSEQTIKPPMSSSVVDKLADLAIDEPLPEATPVDRIRLLAQSPRKLFVYWGLAKNPYSTLANAFGARGQNYSLVIRLVNPESGDVVLHEASSTKSQWLEVQPGNSYRVDLGLYSPGRAFIRLLSSNVIDAPRSGVASTTDPSPTWNISAEKFARVLDQAGYVSDALEVTLEAVDAVSGDIATRSIAGTLGDEELPELTSSELAEFRRVLAAIAFGARFESLRSDLSPTLAEWFARASAHGTALNSERLVQILRNSLGIEMSQLPYDSPAEDEMRRAVRAVVGASEINLPARPFHLWMPSMSASRLKTLSTLAN
jgi:hypothetical protein